MTCIAWDGNILAADKLSTQYGQKQTVTKLFRLNDGSLAGITGDAVYGLAIIKWLNSDRNPAEYPKNVAANDEIYANVLVVSQDWSVKKYQQNAFALVIEDKQVAMGSGQDFAMAAMYCGKTAIEAVKVANELSKDCGNGFDYLSFG